MKKLLYSLILLLAAFTVHAQTPAVTMVTTATVGSKFSIGIAATANNTTIQVDWGNGILTDCTVGRGSSSVIGTLTGSNIKVYGMGITYLNLSSKNLTAIDVSGAIGLTNLACYSNQLISLNVSKNIALTELYCDLNQLTNLDISNNIGLTTLWCSNNKLTVLDVSKNNALTSLCCAVNLLTKLDVSKNTALTTLDCSYNKLTNLDVSKNISLATLDCAYNKLTTLDVFKNTALTTLNCYSSQLTTLDISKNIALINLDCYSNQLTNLDISNNVALTTLWCSNNKLTVLDVSKNRALTALYCYSNQLTYLDVSKNIALISLGCRLNQLVFTTLPIKQSSWTTFSYNPQSALKLHKNNYIPSEAIDLNSQLVANGNTTAYVWKTKGGTTLTSGVDYTANNGVFTFLKTQSDSVYCAMTNATIPDLTLNTTNVKITTEPTSVEENEVKVSIFPNPVSDNLSIESAENIVRVEVFTVTGLMVYAIDGNNTNTMILSVASCPKGLLIVKVYGRDGVMQRKVIKD